MSEEELAVIERMVRTAGLIRVWSGSSWVDLRDIMTKVLVEHSRLLKEYQQLKVFADELTAEHNNLKHLLFSEE